MTFAALTKGSALWYLARGSGIVALLLLSVSVVLGVLTTERWRPGALPRFVTTHLHRNSSLLAVVFLALHIATVVADGFAPIGWLAAVIPFASPYRRVWLGLGAVAVDLLLAVLITTALRQRIGARTWKAVHWLSYACWPVAVLHALGSGTDVTRQWMLVVLAACTIAVGLGALWRIAGARGIDGRQRALAGAGVLLVPLLLALFAAAGPLRPGWARRAGTPADLLAAPSSSGRGFTVSFTGSLQRSNGGVVIAGSVAGDRRGTVTIDLRGDDDDGTATFDLGTDGVWTGSVDAVGDTTVVARVSDATGATVRATLDLAIDGTNLTGTLTAVPTTGDND
jgi:DMSO/TMAO reductase YedYZ heme-binding membrane subunit